MNEVFLEVMAAIRGASHQLMWLEQIINGPDGGKFSAPVTLTQNKILKTNRNIPLTI